MAPSALRPVFTALRLGLHLLVVGLTLFVVVRALLADAPTEVADHDPRGRLPRLLRRGRRRRAPALPHRGRAWCGSSRCSACGSAMSCLTPDAAFLAFPLFFLELHVLAAPIAVPLVVITFGLVGVGHGDATSGSRSARSSARSSAPASRSSSASGYRAMSRRDARPAGAHPRPARHARGARRGEPRGRAPSPSASASHARSTTRSRRGSRASRCCCTPPSATSTTSRTREKLRLARETAAENLGETRRFIRELTPPVARRADPARRAAAAHRGDRTSRRSSRGRRTRVVFRTQRRPRDAADGGRGDAAAHRPGFARERAAALGCRQGAR